MKPLLTPTATEIVRCVREALEGVITPVLKGQSEYSYATTAAHLLAYVERRIEDEGQTLLDEVAKLHALLPQARAWLATQPGTAALSDAIATSLAFRRAPEVYPSLKLMADQVAELRQHVCEVLELLQTATAKGADGEALHAALRDYIAWQLEVEGGIVEPSFVGRGPRR